MNLNLRMRRCAVDRGGFHRSETAPSFLRDESSLLLGRRGDVIDNELGEEDEVFDGGNRARANVDTLVVADSFIGIFTLARDARDGSGFLFLGAGVVTTRLV
jgi:hypothetical protein